ncbi:RagB/SusD family nutrient uptake outer membrane protein [Gelidibacter maritimus]|uniref:RagB/SusD family nutrient uptake outer membrane protein n=1 Tax=Gelidibacter maritimus TaxID=2761487 RepID=A0A7W2R2X7_9FLAO|nr:RagB/SusD family nutrient uptake outer membrane protein [Gelidibacter maritimus]MBA6152053.1 RagB/SusD family nutrient uptake outer membrane protein [Gelidibacter maritimus]
MKTYSTIFKSILCLSLVVLASSCSIDDVKPINQLTEENAIRDAASAQAILNGVYDLGREFDVSNFPLYLAGYGNEGRILSSGLSGSKGYNTNEVPVENRFLTNLYNGFYKIINLSNFLIEELEAGKAVDISESRKMEMISEAKFQRAFTYFNLLRYFGQFYDLNSEYGVVVRTEFATNLTAQPRNSVQDVYNLIQSDLEYAAENGPMYIEHFYSGSLAAKALLSKVELYLGNYDKAALLAEETINNGEGYMLEAEYNSIFTNSFNSSEVIWAPLTGPGAEGGTQMDLIARTTYSENLRKLADAQVGDAADGVLDANGSGYDPRFSFAYSEDTKGQNTQAKYPFGNLAGGQNNTLYHLRLGEIYLIHAEAEARREGGDLDVALESLNTIRQRAGVDDKVLSDQATLLEDIRQEKLLELFFENGEPWFDVVRYDILGNLDASAVKETLTSENKFILPMTSQVMIGNNTIVQNPGY